MLDNKPTIWELQPHTLAKHIILKNYLRAWFPIMGKGNSRILFIDGYAGPGMYAHGEEGSPIVALQEAVSYLEACTKYNWGKPEIVCLFIEKDADYHRSLEQKVNEMSLPAQIKVQVAHSGFEETAKEVLDFLKKENAYLAPAFVFVDPFGYNIPFDIIQRLMRNPKCEVFINFMFEFVNRFIERDGQDDIMTALFGGDDWKTLRLDGPPPQRRQQIHDLYKRQLESNTARYVRSFEMKGSKNTTKYFLFYGTNHPTGLEKMKAAMWRVQPGGTYTFSDATNPAQAVFFGDEPDYTYLKSLIVGRFQGTQASIEEIEEFVLCDTPFLPSHIKKPILKKMEENGEITVPSIRKQRGTYPKGTIIEFS